MHITTLYCSTYSQGTPLTGFMEVQLSEELNSKLHIKLNDEECAAIHEIANKAYARDAKDITVKLMTESPRLIEIAAPVGEPSDDEVPF